MKKIIVIAGIILLIQGMFSCTNQKWSFPDFDYTTTYFPYQFPVRTIVLGDYYFDNSSDKELKFKIGAHMGGVYENKEDIKVGITVDESLTENLYHSTFNNPILPLPSAYYTMASTSEIVIPNGSIFGMVEVQLAEAFLNDTLSISTAAKGVNYVIPLRITSSTTDSVLQGSTLNPAADPRVAAQWIKPPKDFTLFGIKYVNEYHGKYLLRGTDVLKAADNSTIETIVYRQKYVERNPVVAVLTHRRNAVKYSNSIRRSTGSPGSFEMIITFDSGGNGTIVNSTRFPQFPVTGTAKFANDAEEWGLEKRDVIYLDYTISAAGQTHAVKDTLTFRDKGVSFEEYVPKNCSSVNNSLV